MVPITAAAAHLDLPSLPGPTDPGPFSLADPVRVTEILSEAGFADVQVEPGPGRAVLRGADDLHQLAERLLQQNPVVAPTLAAAAPSAREAAVTAAADALRPHEENGTVTMGAGTWIVTAAAR